MRSLPLAPLIVSCVLLASGCQPPLADPGPRNSSAKPVAKPIAEPMDMGDFEAIKVGMTYREVVEIVGQEGEKAAVGESDAMYDWDNNGKGRIAVSFTNDRVVSKIQARLPPASEERAKRKADTVRRVTEAFEEREAGAMLENLKQYSTSPAIRKLAEEIITKYPRTKAAAEARMRLASLK